MEKKITVSSFIFLLITLTLYPEVGKQSVLGALCFLSIVIITVINALVVAETLIEFIKNRQSLFHNHLILFCALLNVLLPFISLSIT